MGLHCVVIAAAGPYCTKPMMGPPCMLRSMLQQDPITPTNKEPTLDGEPLHAEVSAAAKPHHTKLKMTDPHWAPNAH